MIAVVGGQPYWLCDICGYPIGHEGIALYSDPSSAKHFPTLRVVCGASCQVVQEDKLSVKPVRQLDWQDFLQALTRP